MITCKRYISEDVYTSDVDKIRYWVMWGANITKKDGHFCFTINEYIKADIDIPLDVFVTGNDGQFKGVFRILVSSKCSGPVPFKNKGFNMFWYSTKDLEQISLDQIAKREDDIIGVLGLSIDLPKPIYSYNVHITKKCSMTVDALNEDAAEDIALGLALDYDVAVVVEKRE